jgi:diguanylate cyclase (GGDEF)-like protein
MSQSSLSLNTLARLQAGVDDGLLSHLSWNQRLLRCALGLDAPGDDMCLPRAHELCRFGGWLAGENAALRSVDEELVAAIEREHERMHAAVYQLCKAKLDKAQMAETDVQAFEQAQSAMMSGLALLKQRIEAAAARIDPLTGLPMRHGFEAAFEHCLRDARRNGQKLFLAVLDLDNFKNVNDRWGHPVGDMVLQHAVARLRELMRESDPLFRFGGEEFVALLRCEDLAAAVQLMRRLLDGLRTAPLELAAEQVSLQVSATAGLAEVGAGEAPDEAIARADRALLRGKLQGRDRYVLAEATDPPSS